MIVSIVGKGGVGKTSLCALLLDELARQGYAGSILAVDADPAMTLHMALGLPAPPVTVAQVRETVRLDAQTIQRLPEHMSAAAYLGQQLQAANVLRHYLLRRMPLHYLALGQGEGPGCYCHLNRALTAVLGQIVQRYDLVLLDNEAGLEHISRYRLDRADLLLVVMTPTRSAQAVARRLLETAQAVKLSLGEIWFVFNSHRCRQAHSSAESATLFVPLSANLADLELAGQPVVALPEHEPMRAALRPLLERLRCA
jgi:CO dehydrogenase maturation factor